MKEIIEVREGSYEQFAKTDFERGLYEEGVFVTTPDEEHKRMEESKARLQDWHKGAEWDSKRNIMDSAIHTHYDAEWDMQWRLLFSGRVPKQWEFWRNVMDTFKEAGEQGIQLSDELIAAGLMHHHWIVVSDILENQRLSPENLLLLKKRTELDDQIGDRYTQEVLEEYIERGIIPEKMYAYLMMGVYQPTLLPDHLRVKYQEQLVGLNNLKIWGSQMKKRLQKATNNLLNLQEKI